MKKLLLYLALIFIVNISYGQTIIDIYPSVGNTPISDTLLNHSGETLTQDLILNLHDGVYSEDINISNITGSTSARIIIKSDSENANNVLIDGIDGGFGGTIRIGTSYITLKNITIQSNNSSALYFELMQFSIIGNNLIDSCIIKNIVTDNIKSVVYFDMPKEEATGNIISNCTIENGRVGIDVIDGYGWLKNLEIINNTFSGQYDAAINIVGVENVLIHKNDIQLGVSNFDIYSIHKGISLDGVSYNNSGLMKCEVSSNKIYSNIDSVRYNAINIINCSNYNGGKFYIKNNFIDIENTDSLVIGINLESSDSIYFLHNSIKLLSPKATGVFYGNMASKSDFNIFFKNNLIHTNNIVFEAIGQVTAPNIDFDNNGYYSPISDAFICETNPLSFALWNSTYGIDDNSNFDNPNFGVFGNPNFNNQIFDNAAPKLAEVNFDINGLVRNPVLCDVGATEQIFVNLGSDTLICYGDTLFLNVLPGFIDIQWSTGESMVEEIFVTTPNNYSVIVQEVAGGPFGFDTIQVDFNPEIITSINEIINPTCFGENTGLIDINTTGGTAPFMYSWQHTALDTNKIENLSAGTYNVTIFDDNICSLDTFFIVTQPDSIEISFNSQAFCGGCTGYITPSVIGGVEPYTFSWSSGTTDTIAYDLCEGTYTLTIIDNSLCVNVDNYSITESGLAYLSGTLSYSGGNIAENDGKVELYKHYIDGASQLELADENVLGTNGFFEFTGVEPEEFYLRGIVTSNNSNYDNIYTSYYLNGGDTTVWEGASALSIACEDTITNLDFVMYELTNTITGPGIFSGTVTYGDGQAKLVGEPVPGAEVFVEQEPNDEPIANTDTDTTGTWNIDNIPVGTGYKLTVDIPGMPLMTTYSDLIIEGEDTINSYLNFFVDTVSGGGIFADTATIIINVNSEDLTIKTYPNPVSTFLTIETEFNSSLNVSYSVIDINGREILAKELGKQQGVLVEKIDMNRYENGVYFVKLKLDNSFYIKKFIKK